MLQMKNWQTGNKIKNYDKKIAYSERLALEGQQEFNTRWYSPKFSPKMIFAILGLRWFISPLHTVINWKVLFNIIFAVFLQTASR